MKHQRQGLFFTHMQNMQNMFLVEHAEYVIMNMNMQNMVYNMSNDMQINMHNMQNM